MSGSSNPVAALLRETLSQPRAAARRVLALNLPMQSRWQALALVIVLSVLFGQVSIALMGGAGAGFMASPLLSGVVQGGLLLATVFAVHFVGRAFGGRGSFADALVLTAWLQFIMVVVQVLQLLTMVVLPPFAPLLGIIGMVLFLWLLTNFVAELHGFASHGKVFAAILATGFALAFVASLVLVPMGFVPPGLE